VVAHLVQRRAREQVVRLHGARCSSLRNVPFERFPRKPVSYLRVAGEEEYVAAARELEGEHEAGVIGVRVELECELPRVAEPVVVDAAPGAPLGVVLLPELVLVPGLRLVDSEERVERLAARLLILRESFGCRKEPLM